MNVVGGDGLVVFKDLAGEDQSLRGDAVFVGRFDRLFDISDLEWAEINSKESEKRVKVNKEGAEWRRKVCLRNHSSNAPYRLVCRDLNVCNGVLHRADLEFDDWGTHDGRKRPRSEGNGLKTR